MTIETQTLTFKFKESYPTLYVSILEQLVLKLATQNKSFTDNEAEIFGNLYLKKVVYDE